MIGQQVRRCLLAAFLVASAVPALQAQHGATTRASELVGCGTEPVGLALATSPGISADGRYVVFMSTTTDFPGPAVLAWFPNLDGAGSFGPLQPITSQLDVPTGVAIAALDTDSRPDIVTSSKQDNQVAWYINDLPFSGTFVGPTVIAHPVQASTVSTADLDGDGDIDVLSASLEETLNITRWFVNDGQGHFETTTDISHYAHGATGLFAADCDGDGDLDVLTAGTSPILTWDENVDGLGSFTSEHIITDSADGPTAVRAADLDGDGDRDLVAASADAPAGSQIRWYRNVDGAGEFEPMSQLSTASHPDAIDVADLDGDGDTDVLAALNAQDVDNQLVWFANDGRGGFGGPLGVASQIATVRWVGAADLDGDGDPDYLVAAAGEGQLAWFPNLDGRGTFGPKKLISGSVSMAQCACPADLDGDGDLDVLLARGFADEVCFFLNRDGHGSFGSKQVLTTEVFNAFAVDAADLDGDGDLDALIASASDARLVWHANLGAATFGPQQPISLGLMHPRAVDGADMDADGDMDVVAYSSAGAITAWFENPDGTGSTFVTHGIQGLEPSYPGFNSASSLASPLATDIDLDGDLDVLVAGGIVGDFTWFENHGTGHFGQTHVIEPGPPWPATSVVGADLDGDSDIDALAAFFEADTVAWYRNEDGQGHYGPEQDITLVADGARSLCAADMDGDRDLDVVVASELDDTVCWFENLEGQGSFGARKVVTATADAVKQVVAADVDRDGDTDLVAVSFQDDATVWHENLDGVGGSFLAHVIHDGPTVGGRAVAVGDVDADRDLDVVMAGSFPSPVGGEVFRHDLALRTTLWVSQTLNGDESSSENAVISSDGRCVGFRGAGALDPDPALWGSKGLFVNDTVTGVTTRVDVSSTGEPGNSMSIELSLSGDGRYAAFTSYSNNLVPGDPTCCATTDVFLRDRLAGTTILLNHMPDGSWAPGPAANPAVSSDGRHIAFGAASALVSDDTNGLPDVYDYDTATGVISRVSLGSDDVQIEGFESFGPAVSGDGNIVAFSTNAALDPLDLNTFSDIYVHDRRTHQTKLVTGVNSAGMPVSDGGSAPHVSVDGRYVLFLSGGTHYVPEATTPMMRPYRRDLLTGGLQLMGVAGDGTPANKPVPEAALSGDGKAVAFATAATNLVPHDTDGYTDVYAHTVEPWTSLGCGDGGAAGTAALQGTGSLQPNTDTLLQLSSAPPSTLAVLFVSLQSSPSPFKGGTLVALPPLLSSPVATSAAGGFKLKFRWPVGFSPGTAVYLHLAISDATASQGVALSNALLALTP